MIGNKREGSLKIRLGRRAFFRITVIVDCHGLDLACLALMSRGFYCPRNLPDTIASLITAEVPDCGTSYVRHG